MVCLASTSPLILRLVENLSGKIECTKSSSNPSNYKFNAEKWDEFFSDWDEKNDILVYSKEHKQKWL